MTCNKFMHKDMILGCGDCTQKMKKTKTGIKSKNIDAAVK